MRFTVEFYCEGFTSTCLKVVLEERLGLEGIESITLRSTSLVFETPVGTEVKESVMYMLGTLCKTIEIEILYKSYTGEEW